MPACLHATDRRPREIYSPCWIARNALKAGPPARAASEFHASCLRPRMVVPSTVYSRADARQREGSQQESCYGRINHNRRPLRAVCIEFDTTQPYRLYKVRISNSRKSCVTHFQYIPAPPNFLVEDPCRAVPHNLLQFCYFIISCNAQRELYHDHW